MLSVRKRKAEDIGAINDLNQKQAFRITSIDNCIIDRMVVDGNDLPIAYGIVKDFAEAIILVDTKAPKLSRTKALRELMKVAIFGTKSAGLTQLHCFVRDENVARLLERKFNFIRTSDIVLVKNL